MERETSMLTTEGVRALGVTVILLSMSLAGCMGSGSDVITQAGSSTVKPLADAWATKLHERGIQVAPQGGGSGAGVTKVCNGEVQIGDMSREMKPTEIEDCKSKGVDPLVWKVAFDGLSVMVNPSNDWADCLTLGELEHIWRPNDPAQTWADVREGFPDEEIDLYGPDSDSGTYEYFNEAVLGEDTKPRSDYTASAKDNVLVEGIANSEYAIGHFGYAYYLNNQDRLELVAIENDAGECVEPSFETIGDGSYNPLSRPLFMVTDGQPAPGTPLHSYFEYAMGDGQDVVNEVGYVPLDEATLQEQRGWL